MDIKNYRGLNTEQVAESRKKYGSNKMTRKKRRGFFAEYLSNLGDPVVRVLLISLAVNIIFTLRDVDWFEVGGIVIAIVLSTTISTLSERSSHAAFERLNGASKHLCRVVRDGRVAQISADEAVVGDLMLICAGERIMADGLLIRGSVSLDQSAMTGESREVEKGAFLGAFSSFEDTNENLLSPESTCSCLAGCLVSSGEGEMLVCRVGDRTFLGDIVEQLQEDKRESPLKLRLNKLAKQISALGYGAAALIAFISLFSAIFIESDFSREVILTKICDPYFLTSQILHSVTLGLTVVIMAVPEGLPMMIAVVLSSNVKRMLKDNVLVRKQTGIEAAGSMNVLFTDKTGTLTRGKMSVSGFVLAGGRTVNSIEEFKKEEPGLFLSFCENVLYNTSVSASGRDLVGGNATERALFEAARGKLSVDRERVISKVPFASENKYSSATTREKIYYKGAPEILLSRCKGIDALAIEYSIEYHQKRGERVIAICESSNGADMRFICAAVLSDPPRREAKASVEALNGAGIDVIMVTGDGLLTAKSIAEGVGIINKKRDLCLTHAELEAMSDPELLKILPSLAVVARAMPKDKSRLVRLASHDDAVVGMTGDGINDAPALRLADVGFAMGYGSDVAKEAGDVVILDGNLASIVKAVLYGRNIFKSIRKFLVFQLTVNFSSALVCMIAPLLGFETPITVSQMLWVNMIMDTLGGLAFAGEAPQKRIMRECPKRRDEPIINGYMAHQILISGGFSALISMLCLKAPFFVSHFRESEGDIVLLSAFFALFIFLGVMQCINSRTDRLNIFNGITQNPAFVTIMTLILVIQISFIYFGGALLRTVPLLPGELLFAFLLAFSAVPFELIRKIIWRFSGHVEGF